jgi:hypothetical protein
MHEPYFWILSWIRQRIKLISMGDAVRISMFRTPSRRAGGGDDHIYGYFINASSKYGYFAIFYHLIYVIGLSAIYLEWLQLFEAPFLLL